MGKVDLTEASPVTFEGVRLPAGAVLQSAQSEVARLRLPAGAELASHAHPEEQIIFVERGRLRVELADDSYEVPAGKASFHPAGTVHRVEALEDSWIVSLKNVPPEGSSGEATGRLE